MASPAVTPEPNQDPASSLTCNDRCDRCGAQAYVQVAVGNGELLFCAHHYAENQSSLNRVAVSVVDRRTDLATV